MKSSLTFSQFLPGEFVASHFLSSFQFFHFMNSSDLISSKCSFSLRQFFMKSGPVERGGLGLGVSLPIAGGVFANFKQPCLLCQQQVSRFSTQGGRDASIRQPHLASLQLMTEVRPLSATTASLAFGSKFGVAAGFSRPSPFLLKEILTLCNTHSVLKSVTDIVCVWCELPNKQRLILACLASNSTISILITFARVVRVARGSGERKPSPCCWKKLLAHVSKVRRRRRDLWRLRWARQHQKLTSRNLLAVLQKLPVNHATINSPS